MSRFVPLLSLLATSCGVANSQPSGSTVTVTLPPPKAAAPSPGFSTPVKASVS
jgi:hypothetical protein